MAGRLPRRGAAIAIAGAFTALRPEDSSLQFNLAVLGRRDQAVALFQRSLALRPDQPGVIPSLNLLQKGLPSGH